MAGSVATVEIGAAAVFVEGGDLIIKVVVAGVVLDLVSVLAADKEDIGKLTSVPVWPFMDRGSWMTSGWPAVIMPVPGVVFSRRVPG